MATKTFRLFKINDKEAVDIFESILKEINWPFNFIFKIENGLTEINCKSANLNENEQLQNILKLNFQILRQIVCNHTKQISNNGYTISICFQRNDKDFDTFSVTFPDHNSNLNNIDAVKIIAAIQNNIKNYHAEENISKILGPELETFYAKREEGLIRLEGLSQKLIENNEAYRRTLDEQLINDKKLHEEEFKRSLKKLEASYNEKDSELKKRELDIDEKLKHFDDLNNRDSRRKLREDIKKELENRSDVFKLTKATNNKRWPIHLLFIFIIIALGTFAIFGKNIFKISTTGTISEIIALIETPLFIISLIVTIIFYIRWNDHWAQMHADEEFRLKRLDLDIDRASWVVEMAMEWKDEKQKEIPKELLDKLTHNLFEDMATDGQVRHPYEDVMRGILNVSAKARIPIPGGGSLEIDKKGLQSLAKN